MHIQVKIGDFGLARSLQQDYYIGEGTLPIKWMPPESLSYGKFSIKSDVWSFGILTWEIVTIGSRPYEGKEPHEVKEYVINKGHLEIPEICHPILCENLLKCWSYNPGDRPSFSTLHSNFETLWLDLKECSEAETSLSCAF